MGSSPTHDGRAEDSASSRGGGPVTGSPAGPPALLLLYGLVFAFFHIMPAFLEAPVWNRLMIADLLDLLTPFVMVGLVCWLWMTLRPRTGARRRPLTQALPAALLVVGAVAFIEGHGMHLSANAIARQLTPEVHRGVYRLTYFFDEVLGHILWDGGIVLLSVGLILVGWGTSRSPVSGIGTSVTAVGALLYGATYFINAVEGQTVVFTLPLAVAIPLTIGLVASRRRVPLLRNPVLWFFTVAYATAACLFVYWGVRRGGFPQFSELGWI